MSLTAGTPALPPLVVQILLREVAEGDRNQGVVGDRNQGVEVEEGVHYPPSLVGKEEAVEFLIQSKEVEGEEPGEAELLLSRPRECQRQLLLRTEVEGLRMLVLVPESFLRLQSEMS